jgi:serine/threonine protein kinase
MSFLMLVITTDLRYLLGLCLKTFLIGEAETSSYLCMTRWKRSPDSRAAYDLVQADLSQYMWALGVMLYALLTKTPLFPVDRNENLNSPIAYCQLATWDDAKKTNKLQCI